MSIITGTENKAVWPLTSGDWQAASTENGFERSVKGFSPALSSDDLQIFFQAARSPLNPEALFPPEFNFCSDSGTALRALTKAKPAWIPPFGASLVDERIDRAPRGLRQAAIPLRLTRQAERRVVDHPDLRINPPPPGEYEFFSVLAGTAVTSLMALDAAKGLLYTWLPASKRWEALESDTKTALAEYECKHSAWRCEVAINGFRSLLFVSTALGLACLDPSTSTLKYSVSYFGNAPAIGAPIFIDDEVWAPTRFSTGIIKMVSSTNQGMGKSTVDVKNYDKFADASGKFSAPVTDGRTAIWPCQSGQLMLRKLTNGESSATFFPWPEMLTPIFEFGCPYLSRNGSIWQLCFDGTQGTYVYLQLGMEKAERAYVTTPRSCSGTYNFRFETKFKTEPWVDPEHGDDGADDEVILPIVESTQSASVYGIKFPGTEGLAKVLSSQDRMKAILVVDDDICQTAFSIFSVVEPARLRLFVHNDVLWAYHPLLTRIDGWTVQT